MRPAGYIVTMGIACALALSMGACDSSSSQGASGGSQASSGSATSQTASATDEDAVAAMVDGQAILESDVTAYIQLYRHYLGCDDDATWGQTLSGYSSSAADVRSGIIEKAFVPGVVIREKAAEEGIEIDASDLEQAVADVRANAGYADSDTAWAKYLYDNGMDEDRLAYEEETALLKQALCEREVPAPDDDEVKASLLDNIDAYSTRRSSCIAFPDEQTADSVRSQLTTSSDLLNDFDAQLALYSQDVQDGDIYGDVGWSVMDPDLPDAYTSALDVLDVGELSPVVEIDGRYCLIYCTDQFATGTDDKIAYEDIPSDLVSTLVDTERTYLWEESCDDYVQTLVDAADVEIETMPSGLPYDV